MAVDNNVALAGNLVSDPELRFTNNGAAIANMRMAVNRRWNKDGEWEEETSFFDVTAWAEVDIISLNLFLMIEYFQSILLCARVSAGKRAVIIKNRNNRFR